jgi:Bacterial PH domain
MSEKTTNTFRAPWGLALIAITVLANALLFGAAVLAGVDLLKGGHRGLAALVWLVLGSTWIGCALFTIRGYTVVSDVLLVHRLFWETTFSLAGLESVSFEPCAMRGSLRLWGNGGLFAFWGHYWSRRLGFYRAFVTDLKKTVVLRLPQRTIVISPDWPEQFVYEIWSSQGGPAH